MTVFAVDIDGTLCTNTDGHYECCRPRVEVIARVRNLHALGHTIILHTARRRIRWWKTVRQLKAWGVPYDKLVMGKPKADHYVDDKAMLPEGLLV